MRIRHVVSAVLLLVEGLAHVMGSAGSFDEVERGVHGLVQNVTAGLLRNVLDVLPPVSWTPTKLKQLVFVRTPSGLGGASGVPAVG